MKILHISTARTWRGGERQIFLLATGLRERGVRSWVMCPADSPLSQRLAAEGIPMIPIERGLLASLKNAGQLRKVCVKNEIDLIHAHDSHAHTLLYIAYRMRMVKTLSIVTRRLVNTISRRSLRKYNYHMIRRIVCISESVRNTLVPRIMDEDRLTVVHSGIKIKSINQTSTASNYITVGYVAAFTEEKNHVAFAKAARALLAHDARFRFLLVGDGPRYDSIREYMSDISEAITFSGHVTDIDAQYAQMDILLHTSDREALGTAILDAMVHALPVVAQDVGGVGEVVMDGVSGYLYPFGNIDFAVDKVIALSEDPTRRTSMGVQGTVAVQSFSADRMIDGNIAIYHSLMSDH